MWAVTDRDGAIQMFVHDDIQIGHRRANARGLNLEKQISPTHGVVFIDDAFMLDGKNTIQVQPPQRYERRSCLCGWPGELLIKLADVGVPQKFVGRCQRGDLSQPQFLRQTTLPRSEIALTAAARLR